MYNCWIGRDGAIMEVATSTHAITADRVLQPAIRVSQPERRRTWWGVEVPPDVNGTAVRGLLYLLRKRRAGDQIIADVQGEIIEVNSGRDMAHLRTTLEILQRELEQPQHQ